MRIGIDYTAAVQQGAGIGRYTRELLRGLAELDRDNEYALFTASRGAERDPPRFPPNFRLRSLPLSDHHLAVLWHRLRLPLFVELITGPVDIFHSPDFTLPPVLGGKTIVTVHDLSFLRYPEGAEENLRTYLERVVPRSAKAADLVLADSQSTKRDLVELLSLAADKVEVLYPGVGQVFRPMEHEGSLAAVQERYEVDQPFILSVGTLQPRKNFKRLIEAYALLKAEELPHLLVLAGGRGWLYDDIFARVEELSLQGEVRFLGYVPDHDLPALFNLADLFVFPSLYEGFGIPILEAMACGTPVVCSSASSLPEVVGDAGLMVEPTDVAGLAAAMEKVLGDEDLTGELREQGLLQAQRFTWERSARKLLEIYRSL